MLAAASLIGLGLLTMAGEAPAATVYSGQWNNTTFNSFGDATFIVCVDTVGGTFSITIDLDGNVFGFADPGPVVMSGALNPDGSADINLPGDPIFGDLTGSISDTGAVAITADNLPSPGTGEFIAGASVTGTFDATTIALNYQVDFVGVGTGTPVEGTDFALGTINATVVPEPASLALLGLGGLVWCTRRR